jgi:hypothetical protein
MDVADWVSTIARAYLAAPGMSREEQLLQEALGAACARYSVNAAELLERICDTAPVTQVDEVAGRGNEQ